MITFSRLGKIGRLGNQLFQVAFITAFAERYNIEYALPYWRYESNFSYRFNFRDDLDSLQYEMVLREPEPGYQEDYFKGILPLMEKGDVNILNGYFQSYRYFSKEHILKIFSLRNDFKINPDKCIAISVRRGDFVTHRDYNNIEAALFRELLTEFRSFKVFVFTDDYKYCRDEFIGSQYEFLDGFSDIQQLKLMSKFEYFILSNSTFSYWGPMLSTSPKRVLYPRYMFPKIDRCELYNKDYWPEDKAYAAYDNPINKNITDLSN